MTFNIAGVPSEHYYSYKAVKNILAKGLDSIAEVASFQSKLPDHENIRGSDYYR